MSKEFPTPSESKQGLDCMMNDDHDLGRYSMLQQPTTMLSGESN